MGSGRSAVWWLAAALTVALAGPALAQAPTLAQAVETLRASLDEWRREDGAYRTARSSGKISPRESQDYAGYVAGLRSRVLQQCEVVRGIGGEEAVEDFDCLRFGGAGQALAVQPPSAVQTDEEKRAALHAKLDALEGDIDESLQKRQQEIRQTSTGSGRSTGSGGGAGGGAAGSGSASGSGKQAGREGGQGTGWSNPDAAKTEGEQGSQEGSAAAGQGARQSGTPSAGATDASKPGTGGRQASRDGGSDDDVVARQLREAAEKETDPVLKEKLWEEYRKYKEGRR